MDILNDADGRDRGEYVVAVEADSELSVERAAVEILARERLIDDGDGNGSGVICTGKCAALEQAGARGCEIFRADADGTGIRALSHR